MNNSGQVILFITLIIGAVISIVAVSTGFILTQKMKQVTIAADTAQAFYAADSAREAALYYVQQLKAGQNIDFPCPSFSDNNQQVVITMDVKSCHSVSKNCAVYVTVIGSYYNTTNFLYDNGSTYLNLNSSDYNYDNLKSKIEQEDSNGNLHPHHCPS